MVSAVIATIVARGIGLIGTMTDRRVRQRTDRYDNPSIVPWQNF